jgi:hypothetical protein
MAYGYRVGEVPLPVPGPSKPGTVIGPTKAQGIKDPDCLRRPPVQVSLGVHWEGAALPQCDPTHPGTMKAGVRKRFASRPPAIDPKFLKGFTEFVRDWLHKNLVPLASDSDTSLASWLNKTNYPLWRKIELMEVWDKVCTNGGINSDWRYKQCKSFMKDENYTDWKHARGINARHDAFKCYSGPIFRLIEEAVFKRPEFIKKISVADRPQYIIDYLRREGGVYLATDYTAFESLFVKPIMRSCEFQLYEYMTRGLPDGPEWYKTVSTTLEGKNICEYKRFTVKLQATRMSGEMCTSLGNGFANLMFMLYVCKSVGCTDIKGVVEGDDGLFRMVGKPPTEADFARLGLLIKADVHMQIETASFCGLVFDADDKINVTNPLEVLASFGWTRNCYARAAERTLLHLSRAKAYSIIYQYPGCPILQSLGLYVLRTNRHLGPIQASLKIASKTASTYERELFEKLSGEPLPVREVGWNTRLLVERLYGVSVEQQLKTESYLDGLGKYQTLELPWLDPRPVWREYWDSYVMEVKRECDMVTSRQWPIAFPTVDNG